MGKRFDSIEERRRYYRNHYAVNRDRGRAKEHKCLCGEDAAEWAQRKGSDGSSVDDFTAMCRPCHHRYDDRWSEEERSRVSKSVKSSWDEHHTRVFSDETRAKMRENHRTRGGRKG